MTEEQRKQIKAFKYWMDTNTEMRVSTIPEYMCKNIYNVAVEALEENKELKVANAELKKTIERWNEVSYEQHEAIKKTRDEMQSLDEELCSRFLIEDCDKEVHEAYRECLDILDKYIHNMYVED